MGTTNQCCPDCGRTLHNVSDYPTNELWCIHCGNRYFATIGPSQTENSEVLLNFRILLLDPCVERRDELVHFLTSLGLQVTPVCHPRQALEAASFRRFDVAIAPSVLPEFECGSFLSKLRCLLGCIKFVLISDQEQPHAQGTDELDIAYVSNAHSHEQLEALLEQIIEEAASGQAPSSRTSELVAAT